MPEKWLPGKSVGHVDGWTGTLGLFVELAEGERERLGLDSSAPGPAFLSSAHVLAPPHVVPKASDLIHSPCRPVVQRPVARHRCAILVDFDEVRKSSKIDTTTPRVNEGDLAVALLTKCVQPHNLVPLPQRNSARWTRGRLERLSDLVDEQTFLQMIEDRNVVFKVGLSTDFTVGRLYEANIDEPVSFSLRDGTPVFFRGLSSIEWIDGNAFSQGGDSGAVIYDHKMRVIGFVTGAKANKTYFYHATRDRLKTLGALYSSV